MRFRFSRLVVEAAARWPVYGRGAEERRIKVRSAPIRERRSQLSERRRIGRETGAIFERAAR